MSEVVDYIYDGIVNTYNQTVEYWSRDDSFSDAADTIKWSFENPDIVSSATKDGITKTADELSRAADHDKNRLILLGIIAAVIYFQVKKGK